MPNDVEVVDARLNDVRNERVMGFLGRDNREHDVCGKGVDALGDLRQGEKDAQLRVSP